MRPQITVRSQGQDHVAADIDTSKPQKVETPRFPIKLKNVTASYSTSTSARGSTPIHLKLDWDPSQKELQDLVEKFQNAESDPLGGWISTGNADTTDVGLPWYTPAGVIRGQFNTSKSGNLLDLINR